MSLVRATAEVGRSIAHARSLFADDPEPPYAAAESARSLGQGAVTTIDTHTRTAALSGFGIEAHAHWAESSARVLVGSAVADTALANHLQTAAQATRDAAALLEVLGEQHEATARAAGTARTATAQRAVLAALRSQAAQASDIVTTSQQQGEALAGQFRGLRYQSGQPGTGPEDTIVGTDSGAPHVQMVDNRVGPLPQVRHRLFLRHHRPRARRSGCRRRHRVCHRRRP